MAKLKNINFMSKERFDSLNEVSDDELYAVRSQVVVESYTDEDGNWCRVYSDGWVEQGGIASATTSNVTINLLKPMKDANYSVFGSYGEDGDLANGAFSFRGRTITSFIIRRWSSDALYWQVKGQGA